MARLENKGSTALPPPPAPTRRSANPWKYSDTARRRDPVPEPEPPSLQDILEEMQASGDPHVAPGRKAEQPPPLAPAPPPASTTYQPPQAAKRGGGIWPLFILLIAVGIIIKVVSQAAETGEWRAAIAPVVAILFIAHGWWRMRQRKERKDGERDDEEA